MYNYVIRTEIDSKNIYTWVTTTQNPPDRNFKWCYYSFNDDKKNIKSKQLKSKIIKK